MSRVDLSVVFPVFNEQENLPVLLGEIREALDREPWSWEVVAVDDGSRDGSLDVLKSLRREYPMLRIIRLARNSGQTAALAAGWEAARGRYVVTIDADLQNDPADIPGMIRLLERENVDMVIGVRVKRKDTMSKRIQSRIGNSVRNWITGDRITDTGCSLKLVRAERIARIQVFNGMHRFLPTLVRMEGGRVIETPVNHRPRRFGESKYGAVNRAARGLADCFAVRWMAARKLRYEAEEVVPE
ncbi:MAG: glycosyltransferase family 2 protein [Thermoanaerobaculia bacterium]